VLHVQPRSKVLLEPIQKFCSHPVRPSGSGLFGFWLRFRSVTGHCGHAPSFKPCQKPKILAPRSYTISGKALRFWRKYLPLALLFLGGFAALKAPAAPPAGYYLVWGDEFDGTSLDPTKWWAWDQPDRSGYAVPQAVTVGGGYLTITTYSTNSLNYSAIVSSDGRFRARYGYTEASVEFNGSPGMFSDFWINSANNGEFVGDPAAEGAEVDVCEHRVTTTNNMGDLSGQVTIDLHWDGYTTGIEHTGTSGLVGSGLGTGFHTYGLLWNNTNYNVSIDGTPMWSTNAGISQRTEVIMLSCEVDSNSFCGIVPTNGYGNFLTSITTTVVDYVHFYAPTTTLYWVGASSADWADTNNWLSNMIPAAGIDAVFSFLSVGNFNITLPTNTTVNSLSIQETPAVSIGGSALTVGPGGIDMLSAINNATITAPLVLNGAQSWSVGTNLALIVTGPVSGTGGLDFTGQGTVVLEGTNSASGTATVSNGTLQVYGVLSNAVTIAGAEGTLTGTGIVAGAVTVNKGTLSGAETITGPVVVNANGTIGPGTGSATLIISNSLTLQPGSVTSMGVNKTAGTNDEIAGMTSLNYGGSLVVSVQGGVFAAGDAYKLFDAGSYSGAFGRIVPLTPGANLAWNASTLAVDGTLRVVSTISSNMTASIAGNQVTLSWPANNLGWILQTQTNLAPNAGISSNWVTMPGSYTTNSFMLNINPAVGSAFYRLALPATTSALFETGDLIVLQVGNGSISSSGAPGYLNDYLTIGGALQTQVALPTTGASALIFGGSSYEGSLSVSADGKNIIVGGYNVALGSFSGTIDSSSSSTVPRAVGSVNAAGAFTLDVKTTQFSTSTIRSAVSDGAGNYWAGGGASGIVYLGTNSGAATISTVSTSTRTLNLVNGNLCFTESGSSPGPGVMAFGNEPTTAKSPSVIVSTAGLGTASPEGFAINPAMTIAYVINNSASSSGGGVQRFNWNGSAWVYAYTLSYTLTSSDVLYFMTADFSGANPIIYATSGESTANKLVTVTDTGAGSTFKSLATAPSGDAFRGVVLAP